MGRFLAKRWRDVDAARIADELDQRLATLFTFVRRPGVSWNSNEVEREVRVAVVHRKISGGRRTARGAQVLERLLTVGRTFGKRKQPFWGVVADRLGALPQTAAGPPSAGPAS